MNDPAVRRFCDTCQAKIIDDHCKCKPAAVATFKQFKHEVQDDSTGFRHRLVNLQTGRVTRWAGYTTAVYLDGAVGITGYYGHDMAIITPARFAELCCMGMQPNLRETIMAIKEGRAHIDEIPAGRHTQWTPAETAIIDQVSTESESWPAMSQDQQNVTFLVRLLELLPK